MAEAVDDLLAGLDRLIAEAEERRVEQMLHIAFLIADELNAAEAEDGLRQIEALLVRMRVQRRIQRSVPVTGSPPERAGFDRSHADYK